MSIYCDNCGHSNPSDSRFCAFCGNKFVGKEEKIIETKENIVEGKDIEIKEIKEIIKNEKSLKPRKKMISRTKKNCNNFFYYNYHFCFSFPCSRCRF